MFLNMSNVLSLSGRSSQSSPTSSSPSSSSSSRAPRGSATPLGPAPDLAALVEGGIDQTACRCLLCALRGELCVCLGEVPSRKEFILWTSAEDLLLPLPAPLRTVESACGKLGMVSSSTFSRKTSLVRSYPPSSSLEAETKPGGKRPGGGGETRPGVACSKALGSVRGASKYLKSMFWST